MHAWSRAFGAAAAALALALLGAGWTPLSADEEPAEEAAEAPRWHVLLVGCTEYPKVKERVHPATYRVRIRLDGSEHDVQLMQRTLVDVLNVPPAQIRALAGWPDDEAKRPTRANILAGLDAIEAAARPGDRVLFHYSGHGDYVDDEPPLDELDGCDEVLLPADVDCPPGKGFVGGIRDDELGARLKAIRAKGANVWLVLDACHSGTGVRGVDDEIVKERHLDPVELGLLESRPRTRGTGVAPDVLRAAGPGDNLEGIVAFYAAQPHQKAPEVFLPNRSAPNRKAVGLLTSSLVRALELAGPNLTFGELYDLVYAGYRDRKRQHRVQPLAEGDLDMMVSGAETLGGRPFSVRRTDDGFKLSGGAVHGIAPGVLVSAYAPGHRDDIDHQVGTLRVTQVELVDATCRPTDGTDPKAFPAEVDVWPVSIARTPIGDRTLRIAVKTAEGKILPPPEVPQGVLATIRRHSGRLAVVRDEKQGPWVLHLDGAGSPTHLLPPRAGPEAPRFCVDAATLEDRLVRIYRGDNLLRLTRPDLAAPLPSNMRLEVLTVPPEGGEPIRVKPGDRLTPGNEIRMQLVIEEPDRFDVDEEKVPEAYDVWALWVDPHYGIWRQWPKRAGESPRITFRDKGTVDLGRSPLSDESTGREHLLVIALPQRKDDPELDLSFLVQPPLAVTRDAGPGIHDAPWAHAVFDLAIGNSTRGRLEMPVGESGPAIRAFGWTTAWGPLRTPGAREDDVVLKREKADVHETAAGLPQDTPSAWSLPAEIRLTRAGPDATYCLVTAKHGDVEHALLDLDGDIAADAPTPERLGEVIAKRAMDPEIAIRWEPARRFAWYDANDDGVFDVLLLDEDIDGFADARWVLVGETWEKRPTGGRALFSTTHLDYLEKQRQARRRLLALQRMQALAGGVGEAGH